MSPLVILLLAVIGTVKGDAFYQQPHVRYSIQVPPPPMGYSSHPVGYASHPYGFTSHAVGYPTSNHQAPLAVYTVPHVAGPYLAPGHQLSVVHGPYLATGPTVLATPHEVTSYSVREPEVPPCRSHALATPPHNNAPTTSTPKPTPQIATPTPPPPTGNNAHYKIPNPLSLFSSFAPPSVNAYHSTNSKYHHPMPESQNVFSIGISTPKFDDVLDGH